MALTSLTPLIYFGGSTAIEESILYDSGPTQSIEDPPNIIGYKVNRDIPVDERLIIMIQKIIITAVVFIAILAWFEFLRTLYDAIFNTISNEHYSGIVFKRLVYALFITAVAIIIVYIVYRIMLAN